MSSRKGNRSQNTQLTDPINYDTNNIIFDEATENNIPGSKVKYYRINVATKNEDGTEGELILGLDKCMSYGVQESRDMNTNVLTGYSISITLRDRDGGSERQNKTIDVIESIVEKCKDHILSVKKTIGKVSIDRSDLKKLNPIFYKLNDEGERDETASPMLYPKLIYAKERKDAKTGDIIPSKILTQFYLTDEVDENGEPLSVDPLQFLGKRSILSCALKIESIFVGQVIKLQCKVAEVDIKPVETRSKRLLTSGWSTYNKSNISIDSNPLLQSYENKVEEEVKDEDELDNISNKEESKEEVSTVVEKQPEVQPSTTTTKKPARKTKG